LHGACTGVRAAQRAAGPRRMKVQQTHPNRPLPAHKPPPDST
jgi:hypothetical protein